MSFLYGIGSTISLVRAFDVSHNSTPVPRVLPLPRMTAVRATASAHRTGATHLTQAQARRHFCREWTAGRNICICCHIAIDDIFSR